MKPNEAAKVAASAGTNGLTPAATATGITIGTTTAADAVLLVVSETMIASSTAKMVMAMTLVRPSASSIDVPIVSASPVSASREPKMACAEQNDCAPVDFGGIAPAQSEFTVRPIGWQQVKQGCSEHRDHAFIEPVADRLVDAGIRAGDQRDDARKDP